MAASRVKFKIEVYDITASSGYKSGSNAISPTVTDAVSYTHLTLPTTPYV